MPCRSDWPEDDVAEHRRLRAELDLVTRLLCEVLGKLENPHANSGGWDAAWLSQDCRDWWAKHQELDRKRKQAEQEAKLREYQRAKNKVVALEEELTMLKKKLAQEW